MKQDGTWQERIWTYRDQDFFTQPSAARMLIGLVTTVNRYSLSEAASVEMALTDSSLNLLFNCDQGQADRLLPVATD